MGVNPGEPGYRTALITSCLFFMVCSAGMLVINKLVLRRISLPITVCDSLHTHTHTRTDTHTHTRTHYCTDSVGSSTTPTFGRPPPRTHASGGDDTNGSNRAHDRSSAMWLALWLLARCSSLGTDDPIPLHLDARLVHACARPRVNGFHHRHPEHRTQYALRLCVRHPENAPAVRWRHLSEQVAAATSPHRSDHLASLHAGSLAQSSRWRLSGSSRRR